MIKKDSPGAQEMSRIIPVRKLCDAKWKNDQVLAPV